MVNVLVTGGAGFMGSHLIDILLIKGYDVIALDDLSGGFINNVNDEAKFHQGSIVDHKLISDLFNIYKFEYVFHLAAYAAEGLSHFIRRFNYTNNLLGSINLINESINHNVKCFVFTSSMAVYGSNQVPFDETMKPNPEDPYGIAKYAVEMDLHAAYKLMGLNSIIFRPHNVYGERQNIGDKYRNVIGIFLNRLMNNQPINIFGDGEQTRAFSYIADIIPIIAKSIDNKKAYNQTFNIGGDIPCSLNELATKICNIMNVGYDKINHVEERYEVKHAHTSHDKLRKYFPEYKNTITLDDGLPEMIEWANLEGVKKSKHYGKYEVIKNMPKFWIE